MDKLPHGWTDQYTIRWLYRHTLKAHEEIARLKDEVARLEREKAGRAGRKATRLNREEGAQ